MLEQKNNLPEEYITEALEIKEHFCKQFKEYIDSTRKHPNNGRDSSSREERRLQLEFRKAIDDLKAKYNIN